MIFSFRCYLILSNCGNIFFHNAMFKQLSMVDIYGSAIGWISQYLREVLMALKLLLLYKIYNTHTIWFCRPRSPQSMRCIFLDISSLVLYETPWQGVSLIIPIRSSISY